MHPHSLSLLAATLATCIATGAGAQRLQSPSTPPTYAVVNFDGRVTWRAAKIEWSGAAPGGGMEETRIGTARGAEARVGTKPSSKSVQLTAPTQTSDAALVQMVQAGSTPQEVTITMMSAEGKPALTYLLHHAVVSKVAINQMDAGASQIAVTRITLTAESVTTSPASP